MAGKRNINRLRKAIKKQDLSGTIEKAAQATKRVAQSASTSSAVKRGANTAKNIAYSAGRRYSNSSNDTNHPNYMSNSKLNTNKEKKKGNKDKAETTTTKAVMEKYKTLTASSGTAATALIGKDTRNKIDKSKKEAEKGQSDVFKWAGGTIKNIIGSQIAGLPDNVENLARTSRYTGTHGLGNVLLDTSTTAARKLTGKKSEKKERPKDPVAKKMETLGGKLLDEGQSDIEKVKEGKSEAAKWGINLATLGAQFATDALITKGIKVPSLSIYNRSYGIAKQDALKDGANEEQAKKKAELSGAIEVATEGLGNAAKPLKAVFGKGVTDDIMETLLNKVVSKTSSKAGKNIVYHGGKTIISAISEGLEEMVSEGLDPIVANKIYAESIGRPHDMTSLKEYAYVGSLGAAMGGILGGGGQIVEYSQGRKVQNVFGADGVKKLAKAASQVDDAAESVKGAALNEMINRGDGIAAGQANELYKAVYGQEIKDLERNDLVDRSADAIMQRENLISPIQIDEETGATIVGRNTAQVFNEQKGVATATVNQLAAETNLQLPEMSSEQISSAVAAIQTGIGGIDEVNLFTVGNPEARTVYEAVTGKTLPETNQETREMLFEEIGKNRINSARLETEKTVDAVRGLVAQDVAQYYEATGQEAFAQAFSNVNIGDAAQVGDSLNTFDDFYRAGRNGIAYADVISVANPTHQNISSDIKRAAWQAGQQDAFIAADTARGVQMRIGETARQARLQRGLGGRLYSDISRENRSRFTASQQGMYRMLARTFGIDIHVVDSLESGANGEYHDGVIYLSMSSDRALEYVFAHEITHHMQDYAPEEYNQLKEFVRAKWGQQGGIDDAVDLKVSQYAVKDVELSREQALDEIIADSTYEMLQDEGFVDELCKTHRGVAQAILDAIKGVLRKLRAVIADGDRFTPAQNEALLSELDILKEFEKMWTDGLMRAAENRAAVGSVGAEVRQQARQRVQPFDITRSEILGNMKKVTEMSPVATLDGSGFEKQEGRPLSQAVMDYYGGEEFYVNNPTLGEVRVGKRGIKSSVQHRPLYGTKIEGLKALKEIISDGVVINASRNYAGKRNDRICVAAPIRIGDDIYYAGVIINRNADEGMQNYYLHDVITIEKNSLSLKDTEAQYESARMDETVSPYTILQQLNNINNLSEKDVISDEGRFSFKEDTSITYDSLVSKPDMKIVNMDEYHIRDGRKGIVDDARKAIKATGKVDNGQHIIHNEDVDRDIIVGRKALLHGLNRHYESNAQVTVHINEYLKNAVKINELAPRGGNINESYILFGYGRVGEDSYPAYFVVNTYENGNTELDDFDVLYSANAKKIEGSALSSQGFNTSLPSTISISDLLDIVNEMYSDILPQSVADHYGNERRNTKLGESVKFSLPDESDAIDYANEHGTENFGVKFSLKNENITPNTKIPYVNHSSYMEANKNDNKALRKLQDKVRALKRGTYENKATGYKADINSKTIGKLIRPTNNKFNAWGEKFNYIENLNAAVYLPELFYNAVYVDTKQPQKKKNEGKQIQGYHHFVAPIYMDNRAYRVMITAREKQNSDALYVVKTEVIKIKEGTQLLGQKPRNSVGMPSDISIPELIDGVKIYDYDMQINDVYTQKDIKYSLPDESDVIDYVNEHEIEFVNVTGFRDYEVKQKAVRQQTYGELKAQVEKLERDKRFTKGKVLDEKSVREQVNSLVVTLMTHSESYTPNGGRRKTNYKLVRDGVHAAGQIYTAMKDGDILAAINAAEIAADDIVQNLEIVSDAAFYEYKDLRDYLRTTRIVISEEDTANIPDFKQFKKNNFGRIRLVQSNGVPIEAAYQELLEMYPELFSEGITHPADMLLEIADVRESLEPYDIMLAAEETEQLIKQTAQDLIDIAALGKPYRSWADKMQDQYDEKLKIVKARHKEALRDVKKNERGRTERILKGERQRWAERVNRANERGNKKVQAEKERAKEREVKRKDGESRKAYMASIEQSRRWLSDRLARPTDDKHIPEGFKAAVADILSQIDMQSQTSKKLEKKSGVRAKRWVAMDELRARFAEIAKEDGSGEFEYDGYIFEVMNSLAEHMNGRAIDEASTEQLKEFDVLMKYIVTNIRNYNKAFDENIKEGISQLGGETISKSKARQKKLKGGKYYDRSGGVGMMDRLLNESMVTPRDFFERIGGGMEKVFMSMRRGMDRHVDNLTKTRDFFDDIFKPYRNKTAIRKRAKPGSIIEKWRDDTHLKEFSVQGGKIKLNPAQIMSLYCLSKREQALGHILGSGVVASRVDKASRIKKALGAKIETGGSTVMISLEDIVNITQSLTEEQKEMADKLQDYLNNECAEWGNEVSMKIYGYRKFTENNYFPIKSADAYLDSNFEGRQEMERIKNFGFTKGTVVNANNPIMIDDIFKTVADHINKMSLYNAFAAPISDFTRVYNYKNRNENGFIDGSVKDALEDAYGKKAINYINNFMADVNNQVQMRTEGIARFVSKSLANYKKSAIGGNLRVALQQPTAVARAFMYINPRYFLNGNVNIVKNLNDMKEHCQIARWKAWGHSQVDMARDIDDVMMNNEWSKIDAVTMEIYGALDNITWSTIWSAVRAETKHKHKDVKVNSEEFYRICNERASEIFDKTQVVDSVFHRSQVMRNTDTMSKMVTSFMAEPTRTFNMMRTQYAEAAELWQEGNKVAAISKMNKATSVFLINAAAVSAAAAVADTLRGRAPDDDDDDSWLKNFFANFWGNVNPLNMIPVVKDIWGYTDGWGTSNMAMEGWEKLVQSAMNLAQNRDAESFKTFAEGLGYVTGLPVKNVIREADSIFKAFGIDVFAAEESDGEKKEKSIFEKIWGILFGKFSKSKSSDGEQEHDKSDTEYYGIYADRRKGVWDKLTNKTEGERKRESFDKRVSEIKKNVDGLTGSEKEKAIWESVTKNYTVYIADGELGTIKEMRRTLEAAGGDVEKFDKSVQSEVKTAMRKNIGGDGLELQEYRAFLNEEYGLSDAKINQEVLMRSEAAKNFQVAACTDDTSSMVTAIVNLYAAGITDGELDVLYINRTKAIKGSDYSTGELAYPVNGAITSAFGYRDQPTAGASTYHEGIDIGAPAGSDVAAADGGRVSKVGWNGGKGYSVTIDHGNGRYTEYNHLEGYYVRKGDAVSKGQIIALVGSTGVSTGPHLDFRVRENGTYIDPIIYFR